MAAEHHPRRSTQRRCLADQGRRSRTNLRDVARWASGMSGVPTVARSAKVARLGMAAGAFPMAASRLRASAPKGSHDLRCPFLPVPDLPALSAITALTATTCPTCPTILKWALSSLRSSRTSRSRSATLREKMLAVDGNGELYQFLALIRLRDGTPLRDAQRTGHLAPLRAVLPDDEAHRRVRAAARVRLRRRTAAPQGGDARETPRDQAAVRTRTRRGAGTWRSRGGVLEGDDDVAADAGDGRRGARAAAAARAADRAGAGRR